MLAGSVTGLEIEVSRGYLYVGTTDSTIHK